MALLKMWCLLSVAALLLLAIIPTTAEVVRSMSDCTGFLLQETPPRVPGILEGGNIQDQNRYKPICQTFNDSRSFVTLYDTANKIPVFSASKYKGNDGRRPRPMWKIEPQLEDPDDDKNMKLSTRCKLYENQAGERDYRIKRKNQKNNIKKEFDRGHLFPSSYALTENDRISTFTLTNIVPQAGPFNQGSWKNMETCIKCVMDDYCINNNGQVEGFLVIGAKPGNNKLNNRVNIPSMLWSAFCCYSRSKGWLASAHWGQNIPDGDEYLQTKTLDELHNELSTTSSEFEVFPGTKCPNNATVTQFYPEVNSKSEGRCNCPSLISTTPAASTTAPFTTTSVPLSTTTETATSGSFPTTSGSPATTTGHATTTSTPSTTATTPTTTETPTTSAPLTTTSIHPTTTFPTTTRPLTATTPPPTTVQTTTTKTTTATTSTTTTTTTTTTKKNDKEEKEKEGQETEQDINKGPSNIGAIAPPVIISGVVSSVFGGLGSLLGSVFGAIGGSLGGVGGVGGATHSANNVLPIDLPPVIVAPKTETTPHPKVYPTTTLTSVIPPSIPPKVVSTIPAITVAIAASTATVPPDNVPVVTTSLHKTTIPEKDITVLPATTTQQSSAIPAIPETTSNHANSAVTVRSTPKASTQTDIISEEHTSTKPFPATATVSAIPQTPTTTFTDITTASTEPQLTLAPSPISTTSATVSTSPVAVTSTPTASTQTDFISEEHTSTKPSPATATVSAIPQTASTTFTDTAVARSNTTLPFSFPPNQTSTSSFQTMNITHPTSPTPSSTAHHIISTHDPPSPSAPSPTSTSSIFQYCQNVINYIIGIISQYSNDVTNS